MGLVMNAHWDRKISVGVIKPIDNMMPWLCSRHSIGEDYPDTDNGPQRPKRWTPSKARLHSWQAKSPKPRHEDYLQSTSRTKHREEKINCSEVRIIPSFSITFFSPFDKDKLLDSSENKQNSKTAVLVLNKTKLCEKKGIKTGCHFWEV